MKEFRKIKSLKFLYEINNDGSIIRNIKSKKEYSQRTDQNGYKLVNLDYKTYKVHRLVAEAWIDDSKLNLQVDHIDGKKDNNLYTNLRWVTPKENINNPNTINKHFKIWEVPMTEERKKNISHSKKGQPGHSVSEEHKKKLHDLNITKNIKAISVKDNKEIYFKDMDDAVNYILNIHPEKNKNSVSHSITRVLRKERKVAYKFYWYIY